MNRDEQNSDMQTWIDPELEARVVAWVSGESSAFEVAELERLTNEKPELALFKRRIEAVRGLVGDAVRPEQAPLRLAPEKRTRLLQTLGGAGTTEGSSAQPATAVFPAAERARRRRHFPAWLLTLAACACFGLFTWTLFRPAMSHKARPAVLELMVQRRAEENRVAAEEKRKASATSEDATVVARSLNRTREDTKERERSDLRDRAVQGSARKTFAVSLPAVPGKPTHDAEGLLPAPSVTAAPAPKLGVDKLTLANADEVVGRAQPIMRKYVGRSGTTEISRSAKAEKDRSPSFHFGPSASTVSLAAQDADQNVGYYNRLSQVQAKGAGSRQKEQTWAAQPLTGEFGAARSGSYGSASVASLDAPAQLPVTAQVEPLALSPFERQSPEAPVREDIARLADAAPASPKAEPPESSGEVSAAAEPVSTFSLHVGDVSFQVARAALARGELPDPAGVRPEEFYNAFDYGDPAPAMTERVSCHIEQAADPALQQRNLVRLAVRIPATGRAAQQPLRLTVLLDTSGSMEREDRAAAVRSAMRVLASLLGANDRITLIGFARTPRLLADQIPGDRASEVLDAMERTPAEGGTNLEEALRLAGEVARRSYQAEAQNRIVLLTDGAANLGNADPAALARSVEELRQQRIAFDACGVGLDGLDDTLLENLTRKGDGRYYVLDTPASADAGFARQLAGAFRPAAENVKLQVRFNPSRVGRYRLIGFERHRLNEEDFRNDQVDGAELASEEEAVALYQVQVLPQGEGELGEVLVRFRDAANGSMVERSWTLPYDAAAPSFERASPSLQLAGVAAIVAENLRGDREAAAARLGDLAPVVNALRIHFSHEPQVQALNDMYQQLRRIRGE